MSERDADDPPPTTGPGAEWPAGPAAPHLAVDAAHVWLADLHTVTDDVLGALSAEEHERAANIAGERERALWTRSRGVLRALLGRYLQLAAGDVQLAAGANGKPELKGRDSRPAEPFFNLSHSDRLALYAFSAGGPVGVDVQTARLDRSGTGPDHIALARRAFGEHEAQRLSLVEPARREREFLRAWACHEAELKRLGTGIGVGDRGTEVERADPHTAPWIGELDVGARAAAALALAHRPGELRRWSWS
jgi:4'-phosphopantetheinyl transferase